MKRRKTAAQQSHVQMNKNWDDILNKNGFFASAIDKKMISSRRIWGGNTSCCLVCIQGKASFNMDAIRYELKAGESLIIDSDFFLLSQEVSNDFKAYAVVATKFFLFSPSFPTSFDLHFYILRHPTMKLPAESMAHLVQLFEMLQAKEAEASEEPGFHFMPDSFSHQITSQLAKIFCLEIYNHYRKALPFGKQGIKSSTKENIVLRFLQLLRSNVEKERRISFYSNALDITPQYLATILKKVTGLSTNQWMHILVIERAKHLLLTENKSIQEVARILNYPDQSTFGKMFKVETGLSPIQFKKEISN